MTGGLLRLPVFVIQPAVAMNRGAGRPGTSSALTVPPSLLLSWAPSLPRRLGRSSHHLPDIWLSVSACLPVAGWISAGPTLVHYPA